MPVCPSNLGISRRRAAPPTCRTRGSELPGAKRCKETRRLQLTAAAVSPVQGRPVGCTNSAGHHKTCALQARPNFTHPTACDSRYRPLDRKKHDEGQHPQPHPSTHAPRPRIAGRPQPQSIAFTRPAQCPQLAPGEDQDEQELPDEPCGKQKEESLQ